MSNTSAHNIADCSDGRSDPVAHQFIANIGTHQRAHTATNTVADRSADGRVL
jgi:hypothetical protein